MSQGSSDAGGDTDNREWWTQVPQSLDIRNFKTPLLLILFIVDVHCI